MIVVFIVCYVRIRTSLIRKKGKMLWDFDLLANDIWGDWLYVHGFLRTHDWIKLRRGLLWRSLSWVVGAGASSRKAEEKKLEVGPLLPWA